MSDATDDREADRIGALRAYAILDTAPEAAFDDIARIAALVCAAPVAQINLVDRTRQWSKASIGHPAEELPRAASFCSHTLEARELMVVEDARGDERFADNPLVLGPPGIVFYAGAPLVTSAGHGLGALCVLDWHRRGLSPEQRAALAALARQVMSQLELRRIRADLERRVAERTLALERAIADLRSEVAERVKAEQALDRERRLQQAVLDNVEAGIVACDADGVLSLFNRFTQQLHGLRQQPIPSERWAESYDLYQADGETPMAEAQVPLVRALRGETVRNVEMVIKPRRGAARTVLASGQAMRDDSGRELGAVVAMHDITERKHMEEARRQEQVFLQALLDNVEAGIVACDADGQVLLFNRAMARMHGLNAAPRNVAEWVDQCLASALTDTDGLVEPGRIPLLRALRGETFRGLELRFQVRGEEQRTVLVSGQPILDAHGRRLGAVAVRHEISDLKWSERELRRQRESLHQSEKLAAMGQLLAGVAHELNNPLAVVIGQADLLRRKLAGGPEVPRVEKIRAGAERCARIVRNFLALARQQPPERVRVAVNQTVEETAELVAYPLRADGIQMQLALTPDLPVLWADRHQLQQVLINLVTNAHHALRGAPAPRRVLVATRAVPGTDHLVIEVADTGPGIPPALRSRIFEPFFTTKVAGQGTGLGLSLCRGIVESHGGSLTVESEPGQGATFRVTLPVDRRTAAGQPTSVAASEAAPGVPRAVLVVDDEEAVRELLADMLRGDGHRVAVVPNGAEALDRLQEAPFDLVLSDLRMPELDGPALYREIARRWPGRERRVAFLTGDTLTAGTREFLDTVDAVNLAKPFDLEQLRRAVAEALGRSPDPEAMG